MGSLGWPEIMVILVIALVIFGPRKLPQLGRTLGKALGEFRRATNDLKNTLELEVHKEEEKQNAPERRKQEEAYSRRTPVEEIAPPDTAAVPDPPAAEAEADRGDAAGAADAELPFEEPATRDADRE